VTTIVKCRSADEAIRREHGALALKADVRGDLSEHGVTVIQDTNASTPAEILQVANLLGTTELGIDPEMSGPIVMDLRVDPSKAALGSRPSYFSHDRFPVHTDMSYVPCPPRFLLTQCVHPGDGGGSALLTDCAVAWRLLSADIRSLLSERLFTFPYPPNCVEGHSEPLPICAESCGTRRWRFHSHSVSYPPIATNAIAAFRHALDSATVEHKFLAGDLLVVDNARVAHGRTAFSPKAAGGRHLRRVYAQEKDESR